MRPALIALAVVLLVSTACRSPRDAAPAAGTAPPTAPTASMVWIAGGTFWMGCDDCGMPDALPTPGVSVEGFWMDRTPVTNAEFGRLVQASGSVTVAEPQPAPKDFPGA